FRMFLCFFVQAEDGIRDRNVTGVQTCALPILQGDISLIEPFFQDGQGGRYDVVGYADAHRQGLRTVTPGVFFNTGSVGNAMGVRSEERRVGKEGGGRGRRGVRKTRSAERGSGE